MEKKRTRLRPISRKRHNYFYLLTAILTLILSGYILFNFSPQSAFEISELGNFTIKIPLILISLFSFSIFIYSLTTFLFFRKTQGVIFIAFIDSYIIMRLAGLTHWIFLVLVIALFVTVELFILKKK